MHSRVHEFRTYTFPFRGATAPEGEGIAPAFSEGGAALPMYAVKRGQTVDAGARCHRGARDQIVGHLTVIYLLGRCKVTVGSPLRPTCVARPTPRLAVSPVESTTGSERSLDIARRRNPRTIAVRPGGGRPNVLERAQPRRRPPTGDRPPIEGHAAAAPGRGP